jgi:hypothetical protein
MCLTDQNSLRPPMQPMKGTLRKRTLDYCNIRNVISPAQTISRQLSDRSDIFGSLVRFVLVFDV